MSEANLDRSHAHAQMPSLQGRKANTVLAARFLTQLRRTLVPLTCVEPRLAQ